MTTRERVEEIKKLYGEWWVATPRKYPTFCDWLDKQVKLGYPCPLCGEDMKLGMTGKHVSCPNRECDLLEVYFKGAPGKQRIINILQNWQ